MFNPNLHKIARSDNRVHDEKLDCVNKYNIHFKPFFRILIGRLPAHIVMSVYVFLARIL